MKRELTYGRLTLKQMSRTDLRTQLETNRYWLRVRTGILTALGMATLFVQPAVGIFVLSVGALTGRWLLQNNAAIRRELNERDASCI